MRAPSGISPAVIYLHKATSSFLGQGDHGDLADPSPAPGPTRSVNQRASALSGW